MARRKVLEVECDRCGRTETQAENPDRPHPEFSANLHGDEVSFEDLCAKCRDAIRNYYKRIARKDKNEKAGEQLESVLSVVSTS